MAKENQTQEQPSTGSLQDFEFDNQEEWFGIQNPNHSVEEVIKEVKGQKPSDKKVEATVLEDEEEEEEEVTFFQDEEDEPKEKKKKVDDEEEEEEEEEEEKVEAKKKEAKKGDDEEDDDFYSTLTEELKEKGIFQNIELKDGEKITEEKFFQLQDDEIEARVNETFEAFFEQLDEDGKRFLKFKRDGGNTADFLATYQDEVTYDALDLDNEEHRATALRLYLTKVEKLEGEDLTDRLNWLKETGKEKAYATKYISDAKKAAEKQREALEKAQAKINEDKEKEREEFNNSLVETVSKTEKVGDFVISKGEQKELGTYLTKPTVKVGKNRYIPAFQAEIGEIFKAQTPEAKQKLVLLAKLVKTNFDIKDVLTHKKTEVVKETQSKLKAAKLGTKLRGTGSSSKKSLEDYDF